jgi:hypothetical protein
MMNLTGRLVETKMLTSIQKNRMLELMTGYYGDISPERFEQELNERDSALVLFDAANQIQGFTTIKFYHLDVLKIPVRLVFSDEAIIPGGFRSNLELFRAWIRAVYSRVLDGDELLRQRKIEVQNYFKSYWVLLAEGYQKYRLLPLYFKRFYPNYQERTPEFEQTVINHFCGYKYPGRYNPTTGVIKSEGKGGLRQDATVITRKHMNNSHLNYFLTQNPGFTMGDKLVCITELSLNNMKPKLWRYLGEIN